MIKTIIGGIAVGLANIIPGVSGGTMMVVLGLFDKTMHAINGLFSKHNKHRKDDFIFLVIFGIGAVIGVVLFAKVLEWCFSNYPTQTMFAFVGMVAFSIPSITKKEMKGDKFNPIPFVIGAAIIFALVYLAPSEDKNMVLTVFPDISIMYLLEMVLIGFIGGGAMFLPGVSGSMILLIIGKYYLFKSLLANATSFQMDILIPLVFMAIGVVIGIVVCSKLCSYFLNQYHGMTMNFILGLVFASSFALIPFTAVYNFFTIVTCFACLIGGGILILLLEKIS